MKRKELEVGQALVFVRGHESFVAVVVDTLPWEMHHSYHGENSGPRRIEKGNGVAVGIGPRINGYLWRDKEVTEDAVLRVGATTDGWSREFEDGPRWRPGVAQLSQLDARDPVQYARDRKLEEAVKSAKEKERYAGWNRAETLEVVLKEAGFAADAEGPDRVSLTVEELLSLIKLPEAEVKAVKAGSRPKRDRF